MFHRHSRAKKIAKRALIYNKAEVPIDIFEFIKKYATIEEDNSIPCDYDAICLFNRAKPHIIFNGDRSKSRIKFTLAHELGHILIPGHRGNIACSLKEDYKSVYQVPLDELTEEVEEYFNREGEADIFASELLMPESWVKDIVDLEKDYKSIVTKIMKDTQLSYQAISIAVRNFLVPGIIAIATNSMNEENITISPNSNVDYEKIHSEVNRDELENRAVNIDKFVVGSHDIVVYYLYEELSLKKRAVSRAKNSTQLLRECLEQHYSKDEAEKKFRRINGIIGSINSRNKVKEMSEEEYFKVIDRRFRSREDLMEIFPTEGFEEYISQKYFELQSK